MATTAVQIPYSDASPAELREAILPESREAFDTQYRASLDAAATTLHLDELEDFLEGWRRTAWVQAGLGPKRYRAMLVKAAYINRTGKVPPGTVTYSEEEMMKLVPWNGKPFRGDNPDANILTLPPDPFCPDVRDRVGLEVVGAFGRGLRGGIFTAVMPASARTASNAAVNCPARSRMRNRDWSARSPRSIRRLRICCTVQSPSGFAVTPRRCT